MLQGSAALLPPSLLRWLFEPGAGALTQSPGIHVTHLTSVPLNMNAWHQLVLQELGPSLLPSWKDLGAFS